MNRPILELEHPSFNEIVYGSSIAMVGAFALTLATYNASLNNNKIDERDHTRTLKLRSFSSDNFHTYKLSNRLIHETISNRKIFANRLRAIREKAILKGMKVLNEREILDEVKIRRGENGIS